MDTLENLLSKLWEEYRALNPQATRIQELLKARGESIQNDHIAFRTVDDPRVDISVMSAPFTALGYREAGRYTFPEKKLDAVHYEHADPAQPKIFISQLRMRELSQGAQSMLLGLINQIPGAFLANPFWCVGGRSWSLDFTTYTALERESDYAAWLSAFGFRPNHFTVLANALRTFPNLLALNSFLKSEGFVLNASGGEIKGSPELFLEQSSTLANQVSTAFSDGFHAIPGCYYEFARRYPLPSGQLFQGFITASANRIFESTDRK